MRNNVKDYPRLYRSLLEILRSLHILPVIEYEDVATYTGKDWRKPQLDIIKLNQTQIFEMKLEQPCGLLSNFLATGSGQRKTFNSIYTRTN